MKRLAIKSIVVKKYQYQKNQGKVPEDKKNILNRDFQATTVFKKLVTDILQSIPSFPEIQIHIF